MHPTFQSKPHILVGGFNPSEKYWSVGIIIPNIWENKKCSKPPTNHSMPNHSYIVTIVIYHSYRGTIFQVLRLLIHSCHRCFPPKQRKVAKQEDCSEIWSPRSSQPAPIRHEDKTMTQTPSAFGFMMFYVRCLSHFETFKC